MPSSATPRPSTLVSLALLTAAALVLELCLTRLLSVALWYPFAYVALGTAMLGFGGAAVALSLSARLRLIPADTLLPVTALAFAGTTVVGYPLWNLLPLAPMSLGEDALQLLWMPLLLVLLTLPFCCVGLFVAKLFSEFPAAAPRLYGVDLGGAAAGVIVYVAVLPSIGAPGMLAVAAGFGVIAALVEGSGSIHRRAALALTATILFGGAPRLEHVVPLRITPNKVLGTPAARAERRNVRWTVASAIDVIAGRPQGALIIIDGGTAMTMAPRGRNRTGIVAPEPPLGLHALPYRLGPGRSTLIIGSGGGVGVRAALGAGSQRIVAIEIDGAINDLVHGLLGPMTGGIFAYPQVELHTAEARSFLAARPEGDRFDTIVAFHTISNAASATGAMSLAEGYTLTTEAIELLLARLSDDGVLVMTRPEQQVGRLAATFAHAWRDGGYGDLGPLAEHVAVVTAGSARPAFLTALVLRKRPFGPADLQTIRETVPGELLFPSDRPAGAYLAAALNAIDSGSRAHAEALGASLPYRPADLRPATDDRPFFNLQRPWTDIGLGDLETILSAGQTARARVEDLPIAQVAVLVLLLLLLTLGGVAVVPTLRGLRRAAIPLRAALTVGATFAAFGLGYILVEIIAIQILTRIVGEPGWSIVTVLATMLLASGAGSVLLVGRYRWSAARGCLGAAAAALFVALAVPAIADAAAALPFAARVSVAALVIAPVGLLLGVPFSATMRRIDGHSLVAWAWAQNSLASVVGSVAALVLSSAAGFTAAGIVGACAYGAAFVLVRDRGQVA